MSLRVAVIGAGIMGADHARILANEVPGAILQVVCDADAARAGKIAAETGAQSASSDPQAVIADTSVDAVLIASPDATHGPLTLAAIAAGKPTLCEKPLAPTSKECLQVIEAEVKAGKRLVQTGFMRRFDPAYVEMKAIAAKGDIGKPLIFHCVHRNVSSPDWFTSEMAITNSAPHEFDIVRFVLGSELTAIAALTPRASDPAKPVAPVLITIETSSGEIVNIEVNVNAGYGYDVRGELVCNNGTVSLRAPVRSETNHALVQSTAYPADWRPRFADAYRIQNQAWVKSILTGKPNPGASAWDGYMATLTGEAGMAALASGTTVKIEPVKKSKLY